MLKRFELPANGRTELEVNTLLSSDPFKTHPKNPALPMLDIIYAPDQCFMVFPMGQEIINFLPATVGEGFDFVEQTLQVRIWHCFCGILVMAQFYTGSRISA